MKISIIIPAHNEEVRIGKTLDSYTKFFKEKKKNKEIENFEIIVVANACKDNTVKVVEKFRKKYREIKLLNFELGGKGFAIQEGFKESLQGDSGLIGFVDADMATSPENFYDLVKKIGNHDGIIASRYLKGSIVKPKQPFMRLLASRIFNFIVRSLFLFNFRDTQLGGKILKKGAVESILPLLSITQWAFDIDLLYNLKKKGHKIKEHPTIWRDISGSKINLKKSSIQMLFAVLKLRIVNSRFKNIWRMFRPLSSMAYRLLR